MPYRCPVADSIECEVEAPVECFACGEPVCKACSLMMIWHSYGTKRIDVNCAREHIRFVTGVQRDDATVDRILRTMVRNQREIQA